MMLQIQLLTYSCLRSLIQESNNITAGDFGLNKPRSPFLIAR